MNVVIEAGGIVSGTQQTFAKNRLVVIFPKDNPAGLAELKDLANPDLKLVLAAKEVPVGQYSLDFLDKAVADPAFGATFKDDVLNNVVSYEDNVKVVLTKVALGEADAGIVYLSDISGADADKVSRIEIPDTLNVIASYPIAAVKESKIPELAQAFIDLVLSKEGQDILAKYNFIPVK
jgi:molybdate transport system substrate-binding protein